MPNAVRAGLRSATAGAHARVENALGLLDPVLPVERVADALVLLHGFWAPTEARMDGWAAGSPELASSLDWPRRRRTALLRADLDDLGAAPGTVHAGWRVESDADALAWLYVAEGSTLGGAVIGRALAGSGVRVPRSFAPYAEGPGPMWRRYLDTLDTWAGTDDLRRAAVVSAAVGVFGALADWVEAARAEGAA